MNRRLLIVSLVLLSLALLLGFAWTPDIAHTELVARYANEHSRFIKLPSGTTAHYRDQGNPRAPVLLLLHGSNASLHTWEPWVRELGAELRVISVDQPGHGLTGPAPSEDYTHRGMADFVAEFSDTLGLELFFLGGNSMGGGVTLRVALDYPQRLAGIVLVDAAGLDLPPALQQKVDLPLAFRLAGRWYTNWMLTSITPRSLVREGLERSFADPALVDEAMVDRYWELARHPGNRQATGLRFAWYRDGRSELPVEQISVPTLILWGDQDRLIPVEMATRIQQRITGSELQIFPGVGHIPMEEAPVATAAAVRAFVTRVLSQTAY